MSKMDNKCGQSAQNGPGSFVSTEKRNLFLLCAKGCLGQRWFEVLKNLVTLEVLFWTGVGYE